MELIFIGAMAAILSALKMEKVFSSGFDPAILHFDQERAALYTFFYFFYMFRVNIYPKITIFKMFIIFLDLPD